MPGRITDKVAFITGVARGLGRANAVRLAEEGADIIGVDRLELEPFADYPMPTDADLEETVALVEKTGRRIVAVKADVTDRSGLAAALDQGLKQFGRLDIVVANAGISPPGAPTWELPPDQWDKVLSINLTGVFNTIAVAVPAMIDAGNGGSIVLMASGAALMNMPHLSDYAAAKAGVVTLAKTLANEVAAHQIRVNALAPGTARPPLVTENKGMFRLFRPDLAQPTLEDALPVLTAMLPMGKPWVEPEDVANAVLFLASEEGRYITGQVIAIDLGGSNRP